MLLSLPGRESNYTFATGQPWKYYLGGSTKGLIMHFLYSTLISLYNKEEVIEYSFV